jgi:hypothetical protein
MSMAHGAKPYIGEGWATPLPLKQNVKIVDIKLMAGPLCIIHLVYFRFVYLP